MVTVAISVMPAVSLTPLSPHCGSDGVSVIAESTGTSFLPERSSVFKITDTQVGLFGLTANK